MGLFYFIAAFLILLVGGYGYSLLAERIYGADPKLVMPCDKSKDGVDYVAMPSWRVFLIQLLNIAGVGPVFGALAGCLFGPAALLWVVFGCILGGAMHDYLAALISAERGGENLPETIGECLGNWTRYFFRAISIFLLILVGVLFTRGPADMLHEQFEQVPLLWWCVVIMVYYFLATVLPINVLIGRLYPYFGALFLFMALGIFLALIVSDVPLLPSLDFTTNVHPKEGLNIWPMIFVTIACGALSGFHATQSPMMVRCLARVRSVRRVFYGAMLAEGCVGLIWCTIGLSLREFIIPGSEGQSFAELSLQSPALAVNHACTYLMGEWGAYIAVLGIIVLPITSGDTAMRCCRLIVADSLKLKQERITSRLAVAVPIFATTILCSQLDFSMIWRYFGWANQVLSCFTLWTIAVMIRRRGRWHYLASLPACFMTCMCITFILHAPECLGLGQGLSTLIAAALTALCFIFFAKRCFISVAADEDESSIKS